MTFLKLYYISYFNKINHKYILYHATVSVLLDTDYCMQLYERDLLTHWTVSLPRR